MAKVDPKNFSMTWSLVSTVFGRELVQKHHRHAENHQLIKDAHCVSEPISARVLKTLKEWGIGDYT
jgi:hypothetical protein